MSSDAPARSRLHPAAIVALVTAAVLIVGAVTFLVYTLSAQPTDPKTQATQRLVQWQEAFEKYRGTNGSLPDLPDGGYCLGTGFPVGTGGTANCRDYDSTTYYTEESSAPLLDALASAGALPSGGPSAPVRGTVGPYALYDEAGVRLLTAVEGACQDPTVEVWNDAQGLYICQILLQR